MVSFGENNLSWIFANEEHIALEILEFLNGRDYFHLMTLNKLFYQKISSVKDQLKYDIIARQTLEQDDKIGKSESDSENEKPAEEEKKKKEQQQKKAKKAKGNITIKNIDGLQVTRLNVFDRKAVEKVSEYEWIHIPFEEAKEALSAGLRAKFAKDNSNFFFKSAAKGKIFVVARCLLDQTLDIDDIELKNGDDENKYESLYKTDSLAGKIYDFNNKSQMIERQREFLEKLQEKKEKELAASKITLDFLKKLEKITIILCQGGYFSVAIYDKNRCIFHKSDHKYVVRKKAGQRQINKDSNSGSNIKSMGSQIRRDQEKKHHENIKSILQDAYKNIENTDIILCHAPGLNKYLVMEKGEPLYPLRKKFRSLCLSTKRANYSEIERVAESIFKVYLIEKPEENQIKV